MGGRRWMCGACACSAAHVRTTATRVACVSPFMSTASQHALCRLGCQEDVGTSRPRPTDLAPELYGSKSIDPSLVQLGQDSIWLDA